MCFSATASFGSGVVLSAIGIASLRKTKTPSQRLFAAIPLLFATQQISEGLLWVGLQHPEYHYLQTPFTYIFLFFAQMVWPVWVPWSIMKFDETGKKNIQQLLVGTGILLSVYLGYCLFAYPVKATIERHHIYYRQEYPTALNSIRGVVYFLITVGSPFAARARGMWVLGSAILISYLITAVFYEDYMISVWCFFAAIMSGIVYLIVKEKNSPI